MPRVTKRKSTVLDLVTKTSDGELLLFDSEIWGPTHLCTTAHHHLSQTVPKLCEAVTKNHIKSDSFY